MPSVDDCSRTAPPPAPSGWLGCMGIAGWFASDYTDWATTWAFGVVLVQTPNAPDPEHLEEVTKETLSMGSPRLRAVLRPDGSWSSSSRSLSTSICKKKSGTMPFEPLLMPARDYFLRPAGPVYRIPARRVASSTRPDRLPGVWG